MALMAAAFRDKFRRRAGDAEPGSQTDPGAEQQDVSVNEPRDAPDDASGSWSRLGGSAGPADDPRDAPDDAAAAGVVGGPLDVADVADVAEDADVAEASEDAADAAGAGEWLAYELHEWSLESRVMLQQLLVVDKVVHSWQGTTLMVHESLEDEVDRLVDEVDEAEQAKEATSRPIGPEDALTAFDLSEWPAELRSELVDLLVEARVTHIFDTEGDIAGAPEAGSDTPTGDSGEAEHDLADAGNDEAEAEHEAADADVAPAKRFSEHGASAPDADAAAELDSGDAGNEHAGNADAGNDEAEHDDAGAGSDDVEHGHEGGRTATDDAGAGADARESVCDLLVREADEERVELLIDDLLAREEEAQFEELDGLEANELLSALFVACDRLRRDPFDVGGLQGLRADGQRMTGVRTPFGFSSGNWKNLRDSMTELLALAESMSGLQSGESQETADSQDAAGLDDSGVSEADEADEAEIEASGVEGAAGNSEALREAAQRMSDTLRTLV